MSKHTQGAESAYDRAKAARHADPEGSTPVEITEDEYWEALGSMPPIYRDGFTAVGEEYSYTRSGEPVLWWIGCNSDYSACWMYLGTLLDVQTATARDVWVKEQQDKEADRIITKILAEREAKATGSADNA